MSAHIQKHPTMYWRLFAVALGLLLAADLLTTLWAAAILGTGAEANPIMRWLLERGIGTLLTVHLAVLVLASIGFGVVLRIGSALEERRARRYGRYCFCWLAGLTAMGLLVVANNVAVIAAVAGR